MEVARGGRPQLHGRGYSLELRKFVRCRSRPLSLCTFARCTLPPGRPLVAHTLGFLSLVGVNAGSNEVYYARCSKTRHLLSSKAAVMQAWTVSAPGTLTFSPACNSHTARHDRVCTTNEHPGGSVQLSNERKLSLEVGSDINKFAMEVLFRVHAAAGTHPGLLPSRFPCGKFELIICKSVPVSWHPPHFLRRSSNRTARSRRHSPGLRRSEERIPSPYSPCRRHPGP